MNSALLRYRMIAYVVGVGLLVLVLVAMPLKYAADSPTLVKIIGPVHGFLYIVYLMAGYDLANRNHWPLKRTLLVLLAGTIPFLSFVAERKVCAYVSAGQAAEQGAAGRTPTAKAGAAGTAADPQGADAGDSRATS